MFYISLTISFIIPCIDTLMVSELGPGVAGVIVAVGEISLLDDAVDHLGMPVEHIGCPKLVVTVVEVLDVTAEEQGT